MAAAEMWVKSSSQPSVCSWHGSSGSADPRGAPSRSPRQGVTQGDKLLCLLLLCISTFLPGNVSKSEKKWDLVSNVLGFSPPVLQHKEKSALAPLLHLSATCLVLPVGWAAIRELLFAASSPRKNTSGRLLSAILCMEMGFDGSGAP